MIYVSQLLPSGLRRQELPSIQANVYLPLITSSFLVILLTRLGTSRPSQDICYSSDGCSYQFIRLTTVLSHGQSTWKVLPMISQDYPTPQRVIEFKENLVVGSRSTICLLRGEVGVIKANYINTLQSGSTNQSVSQRIIIWKWGSIMRASGNL